MRSVKGMVQVAGTTYRITRIVHHSYEVVRLTDDLVVGRFHCGPLLQVEPISIDAATMHEIARCAVRNAKTSWEGPLYVLHHDHGLK